MDAWSSHAVNARAWVLAMCMGLGHVQFTQTVMEPWVYPYWWCANGTRSVDPHAPECMMEPWVISKRHRVACVCGCIVPCYEL